MRWARWESKGNCQNVSHSAPLGVLPVHGDACVPSGPKPTYKLGSWLVAHFGLGGFRGRGRGLGRIWCRAGLDRMRSRWLMGLTLVLTPQDIGQLLFQAPNTVAEKLSIKCGRGGSSGGGGRGRHGCRSGRAEDGQRRSRVGVLHAGGVGRRKGVRAGEVVGARRGRVAGEVVVRGGRVRVLGRGQSPQARLGPACLLVHAVDNLGLEAAAARLHAVAADLAGAALDAGEGRAVAAARLGGGRGRGCRD